MVMPCSRSALSPSVQQGQVDVLAGVADRGRVLLQRGQLILVDHLGVVQQPPDQGGLAVVDRPAGEEAQQVLLLVLGQVGVDVGGDEVGLMGHGPEPPWSRARPAWPGNAEAASEVSFALLLLHGARRSWSITRPSRSERVASSISWMISGTVAAMDSTAPDSGIAPERAEPDRSHLRRLAVLEAEPVVVDHDRDAVAVHDRSLGRSSRAGRSGSPPAGCTARCRARSSWRAGRPGWTRPGLTRPL